MFTIRDVNLSDTRGETFLFSESMTRVAKARGWWQEGQPFDFTRIYSYGEYYSRGYSSRRMWRAFSLLNPALSLQPELDAPLFLKPVYPFSVVPAEPVSPRTFMALHRDFYQNTTYDLSRGLAAGPWRLPMRFNPEQAYDGNVTGTWERPMGSFRTGYTVVIQSRNYGVGGVLHFAPHASLGSTFVPVFQGALETADAVQVPGLDLADIRGVSKSSQRKAPKSRSQRGAALLARRRRRRARADDNLVVDRRSLYWACRYALNIAYARFQDMHAEIAARQDEWEMEAATAVNDLDARVVAGTGVNATELHDVSTKHVEDVLADWWDLSDTLIRDWSDGFYRETTTGDVSTEYPKWWLAAVGYAKGPPNPTPNVP
jgi:dipeptidase